MRVNLFEQPEDRDLRQDSTDFVVHIVKRLIGRHLWSLLFQHFDGARSTREPVLGSQALNAAASDFVGIGTMSRDMHRTLERIASTALTCRDRLFAGRSDNDGSTATLWILMQNGQLEMCRVQGK